MAYLCVHFVLLKCSIGIGAFFIHRSESILFLCIALLVKNLNS